jgi:hypothetical protein
MYVVKTIYKYEAEITTWHPCTFRKQNAPKSIELQEKKHTALQKGAQLKSTGTSHVLHSATLLGGTKAQK